MRLITYLSNCISPIIGIGREIQCLQYVGYFKYWQKCNQKFRTVIICDFLINLLSKMILDLGKFSSWKCWVAVESTFSVWGVIYNYCLFLFVFKWNIVNSIWKSKKKKIVNGFSNPAQPMVGGNFRDTILVIWSFKSIFTQ